MTEEHETDHKEAKYIQGEAKTGNSIRPKKNRVNQNYIPISFEETE